MQRRLLSPFCAFLCLLCYVAAAVSATRGVEQVPCNTGLWLTPAASATSDAWVHNLEVGDSLSLRISAEVGRVLVLRQRDVDIDAWVRTEGSQSWLQRTTGPGGFYISKALASLDNSIDLCLIASDSENDRGSIHLVSMIDEAWQTRLQADSAPLRIKERLEAYRKAAQQFQADDQVADAAESYAAIGLLHKSELQAEESVEALKVALDLARGESSPVSPWISYSLAGALSLGQKKEQARSLLLEVLEETADPYQRGALLSYAGALSDLLQDLSGAQLHYRKANEAFARLAQPPERRLAILAANEAELARSLGQPELSVEHLETVTALWQRLGSKEFLPFGYANLAFARIEAGDLSGALSAIQFADTLPKRDVHQQIDVARARSLVFQAYGDWRNATAWLRVAQDLLRSKEGTDTDTGQRFRVQMLLSELAQAGRGPQSFNGERVNDALEVLSDASLSLRDRGLLTCALARAQAASGDPAKALEQLHSGVDYTHGASGSGVTADERCASLAEVEALLGMGKPEQALQRLDALAARLPARRSIGVALDLAIPRARALRALKQAKSAGAEAAQVLQQARAVVASLPIGTLQQGLLERYRALADQRVLALVEAGDASRAFAESAALRGFLLRQVQQHKGYGSTVTQGVGLAPLYAQRERLLQTSSPSSSALEPILRDIETALKSQQTRADFDELQFAVPPFDAATLVQRLRPDQHLLYFQLGPDKGLRWHVSTQGVALMELPGRSAFEQAISAFVPSDHKDIAARSNEWLSRWLLPESLYHSASEPFFLFIVPDGPLHRVPFAALKLRGSQGWQWLVEKASLTWLPWLSLPEKTKTQMLESPLFIGASDGVSGEWILPGTSIELDALRRARDDVQVRRTHLTDPASLLNELSAAQGLIHISSHGFAHPAAPELSAISSASEPWSAGASSQSVLSAIEVANGSTRAALVFLSACDAGAGPVYAAEGPKSVSQAFLAAGAAATVASPWPVSDAAAGRFAELFYSSLGKLGASRAIQTAQIKMSKEVRWRDPRYWSGYRLTRIPAE